MIFYKYNASGNDFVIYEDVGVKDRSELAKLLCDRHLGIGADGLIAILPHDECDFEWDFYNQDGSKAEMCGNGARAAAHFAVNFLGKDPAKISFLTKAGVIKASVEKDLVEVALSGVNSVETPFESAGKKWQKCDSKVPHLVHFCDDLSEFDEELCQKLRKEHNANVDFAQVLSPTHLKIRTFERGVEGETLACGTGMVACFYLAFKDGLVQDSVKITPKSGEDLFLRLENEQIFFKGKVRCCFEARYHFS